MTGALLDGDAVALKRCRHGPMLYLKRDQYVGRSLDLYGEFSEIESEFLASYAPSDGVAIDAGANIGAHTVALARAVGPRGAAGAIKRHRPVLYVEADREDKVAGLIELLASMGYALYLHAPPLYNPRNFRGNAENVFGGIVSANLLGIPHDRPRPAAGLREIKTASDVDWFAPA